MRPGHELCPMCRTRLGVPPYQLVSSRDGDIEAAGHDAGENIMGRARSYTELALGCDVENCPITQLPMEHPVYASPCKHQFEKSALEVRC